jgi:hypothetical protein
MIFDLVFRAPAAGDLRIAEATPEELRAIRFWEEWGDVTAITRLINERYSKKDSNG